MSGRNYSSFTAFLRRLLLALTMLGLVAQPVLACVGTLHEWEHAAAQLAVDEHAEHAHESETPMGDEAASPASDMLHLLMHHAPCCGQSAMAFNGVVHIPSVAGSVLRVSFEIPNLLPASSLAPFRPPIQT